MIVPKSNMSRTVCDRKGNSGRNQIAKIWTKPEPDQHPQSWSDLAGLAGFLTGFDTSSSVVLS